jgi:hypothetical protein
MPETYEEMKRLSQEQFADVAAQTIEETTASAIIDPITAFAATLESESARYVPVVNDPIGLYGWCSDGVLEKVRRDGGSILFGWCIWQWRALLVTGEFHAVWVDPGGALNDITPKPHGETRILFVPAPSYPPNFDFDKRPLSKRARLYQSPDLSEAINEQIETMKPTQLAYEQKRAAKAGLTMDQWLLRKRPFDPMPKLIDDFIRTCDEHDRLVDAMPGFGFLTPTPELMKKSMEKNEPVGEHQDAVEDDDLTGIIAGHGAELSHTR